VTAVAVAMPAELALACGGVAGADISESCRNFGDYLRYFGEFDDSKLVLVTRLSLSLSFMQGGDKKSFHTARRRAGWSPLLVNYNFGGPVVARC
jgi:hypothetical protein